MPDPISMMLSGTSGMALDGEAPDPAGTARDDGGGCVGVIFIERVETLRRIHGDTLVARLLRRIEETLRRLLPERSSLEAGDIAGRFDIALPQMGLSAAWQVMEKALAAARRTTVDVGTTRVGAEVSGRIARSADPDAALLDAPDPATDLRDGLTYHLQPIRALSDRRAVGYEALVRWTVMEDQPFRAERFAARLERIPTSSPSLFASRLADAAAAVLDAPGQPFVTLNVGCRALEDPDSDGGRWLAEIMDRVPPDRIVVEILEGAVAAHPDRLATALNRLRDRGVRIALDDFGSALSNLDRLALLRPDIVKIDRTLCTAAAYRQRAILSGLVAIAEALSATLIAEGMETEADIAAMRDLGIPLGQGYALGRPAPAEDWATAGAAV